MTLPANNIHILIVDDFATMRKIVKAVLKQMGYSNFSEAADGASAFEKLKNDPTIKFVVSDWNMPEMSGLELLKNVRAHPERKNIPFLLVTAEADKSNIVAALEAGVDNYIVKPFNLETMKDKMQKIFDKKPIA